jgi:4-hydroxy-tetrahydrodipicolinate synthase
VTGLRKFRRYHLAGFIVYNCCVSNPNRPALRGVFAAAITPLTGDFAPDEEAIPQFLDFLARRGCHGALLLGTTGEGPSFSPEQRARVFRAATKVRRMQADFLLLAGTGTPSLEETILLTRTAFEAGFDGVVVLPPYYFRHAGDEGLLVWFSRLIKRSVPRDGRLLAYHIPPVTGVPFSINLLARLKDSFPDQFAGLKDSSGEADFALQLGSRFGRDLAVFSGNDRLFSLALQHNAAGCVTAPANVISPLLRGVWDSFENGSPDPRLQDQITAARDILERYQPAPALLKALLVRCFGFPRWPVCPPLLPLPESAEEQVLNQLQLA